MPQLSMSIVLRMDALSLIMSLLVTGVGAAVMLYCARYFPAAERSAGPFAAQLFAFAAAMLGLVLSDDLVMLFIFWELTTVLSFLLIGYSAHRVFARRSAIQALVVTTFGGLTMLVGLLWVGRARRGPTGSRRSSPRPRSSPAPLWTRRWSSFWSARSRNQLWCPSTSGCRPPWPPPPRCGVPARGGHGQGRGLPGGPLRPGLPRHHLLARGPHRRRTPHDTTWAARQALEGTDVKLILAYGTVSQLGFMTMMASFGDRDVTTAAVALLLGHSMFKGTLFLTVGIIDHRVGTRDLRKLSGYGRSYPLIAVFGTVSAASMAGLPPTMGYLAKEAVYGTLLDHGTKLAIVALIGVFLGSVLTVAYSARFVWGAFASKPGVEATVRTERDGPLFTAAPAALTLMTIGGAFAAGAIDRIATSWSSQLPVDPAADPAEPYHIALWHGFEPALLLSALTIAAGLTMFVFRRQVSLFQAALPDGIDFHRSYRRIIGGLEKTAAFVTARTQRGSMPFYQGVIYVFAIGALGITLLNNDVWPEEVVWVDSAVQVLPAAIMVMAAVMVTRMTKRFAAVVVCGLTGYAMVVFFALQGAPDLALTQILVETITIVVFVFVLRRLPARIGKGDSKVTPALRTVIAVSFAVVMMVLAVVALGARQHLPISDAFPRLAFDGGHGQNIVNVTLVDIRAWDTMGELAVVIACAIGVASLVFVTGQGDSISPLGAPRRGRSRFVPVTEPVRPRPLDLSGTPESQTHTDPAWEAPSAQEKRNAWLLAGRTLAPGNRSIVLEVAVRLQFHAFLVFSVYLLFAGHNNPGGGFAAGLVAGLAFITRYLAGGRYEFAEAVRLPSGLLMGVGMLLAAGTAAGGFLWGDSALQSFYVSTDLPILGYVSFGSSVIFDIGVYFIVVGLVVGIIRSLAVEVDIQLVEDEDRIADELPNDVDTAEYERIRELLGRTDRLDVDGTSAGGRL